MKVKNKSTQPLVGSLGLLGPWLLLNDELIPRPSISRLYDSQEGEDLTYGLIYMDGTATKPRLSISDVNAEHQQSAEALSDFCGGLKPQVNRFWPRKGHITMRSQQNIWNPPLFVWALETAGLEVAF